MARGSLLARVAGEYHEMPGLSLTIEQACRLWQIDSEAARRAFDDLVADGTLYRTPRGHFVALPSAAQRPLKASLASPVA